MDTNTNVGSGAMAESGAGASVIDGEGRSTELGVSVND